MSFTDSNDLVEVSINLVESYIKSKIAAALASVRTDRSDSVVSTEVPKNYYLYSSAITYRCPSVFIIPTDVDFVQTNGSNHVNAIIKTRVAVVVEDKDMLLLNKKVWRYQSALFKILNQTTLTSTDSKVKIVTVVQRATFSPEFTIAQQKDNPQGMYQKEVALEIDVRHFEAY